MSSSVAPMRLPSHISKYELLEFLGGGMSHVFRAQDTVLGRTVAIKVLTPAGVSDPDTKARFLHEARTASCFSHENIMAVYDFGEDDGRPFMVMEFLRGNTLRAEIQENRIAGVPAKLRIALQVARALSYVHQNQTIHRDVKPENINIDESGRAKLMDFGIAKAADLSLTQPGYVLGTPYYMAPEQIMGKTLTASIDVYAFGIMLYEMLLGLRPYTGDTIETIFYKIMHEPLDLSPLAKGGVSPQVVAIVARCTKKEPEARYPNFGAVISDLENALGTQAVTREAGVNATTAALVPGSAPGSKLPLFAGIAIVLAAVAGGLFFWTSHRDKAAATTSEQKAASPALSARITTPTGMMCLVPAGAFKFGVNHETAHLPAFYMDRTEVSNQSYAQFCDATGHALPQGFDRSKPNLPVVHVTMLDARAYAKWAGKRLPSAREWEKAARGSNGLRFPWGEEEDLRRAVVADNPDLKPSMLRPVTDHQDSASPFGVLNLLGNVWELVEGAVTPSPRAVANFADLTPPASAGEPWVTIRGGSYRTRLHPELTYDFQSVPERFSSEDVGFRCVREP